MQATFDVRLLDSTYSVEHAEGAGEVIVKLFGKTRDNKSITILCPDFKPYFFVFEPSPELRKALESSGDVLKVEDVKLEYKGALENFVKVTVRAPWLVPRFRNEYELKHKTITLVNPPKDLIEKIRADPDVQEVNAPNGAVKIITEDRVYSQKLINRYGLLGYMDEEEREKYALKGVFFAADIVFTNRFIYDMDLETCVRVTGEVIENSGEYTTDIVLKASKFEKCDIFTPKLKIMSFDIESSIKHGNIYCICLTVLNEEDGTRQDRKIFSSFGPMDGEISAEERKAREDDERRILKEFVSEVRKLDPDVITGYNINNFDLAVLFDRANKLFKGPENAGAENKRQSCDALNFGRDMLGMSRRENRATGFVTWDIKGRLILDAWLSIKKELRPKREGLGYVSSMLFNDTKENIDSSRIDEEWRARRDEVVHYCLKDAELALRILIHPRIQAISKLMDVAIPAKLPVKEVSGGQNRMIESLLIRMVDRENVAVPMSSGETYEYEGGFVYDTKAGLWEWVIGLDFSSMYPSQIIKHNICFTTFTRNRAEAAHISPIGAMFVSKEKRYGIVPRMVQGLLDSRKQAKALMKKAKEDGDAEKADYYNRLQNAIKIMANATYGYFGTKFCRWPYNKYIAPSITAWAREEIKTVVATLESRGYTVIAGDTDSVFFTSKEHRDLEKCKLLGFMVQQEFSAGNMHLELEKVMRRFFAHAKKRYFGKIIWPEESLLVRGYEPRRTDSFDLQSETMTRVFQLVLDGRPDEAVKYAKDTVHDTLKGKVDLSSLVISKSVNEFDAYDNPDSLVHVNVARKLKDMGYDFTPGMKTPFIITNGFVQPQKAEPVIEGVEFTARPDFRYYAERLAMALARITEPFGCDERALLQGNSQRSLEFFCEEKPVHESIQQASPVMAKKVKQKATLDMFM
ncbi:replicative DNA polymerase I [Methanocella conradii HZ254]|uniref:DNA-directed DNA polymerase n=1 Tax=Methanocella conradii (strain DSM 24694 / JCM 17849 / CGMCC 1.5162 / HZ254) TaxID=1041930 RepID=H8I788_METCZ|nr:DNA polymerase II [Methanocella conradii]AFD00339.1 replicative DNA polymerase I [Methanocella conradii HZ254]